MAEVGSGNYPGGRVLNKVLYREAAPRSNPLQFHIPFFLAERYTLRLPVMTNEMFELKTIFKFGESIIKPLNTMETNGAEQSVCRVSADHRRVHTAKSWSY